MTYTSGEVTTNMVDVTELSLAELRRSDDPLLHRSLEFLVKRTECSQAGVLQNQVLNEG